MINFAKFIAQIKTALIQIPFICVIIYVVFFEIEPPDLWNHDDIRIRYELKWGAEWCIPIWT